MLGLPLSGSALIGYRYELFLPIRILVLSTARSLLSVCSVQGTGTVKHEFCAFFICHRHDKNGIPYTVYCTAVKNVSFFFVRAYQVFDCLSCGLFCTYAVAGLWYFCTAIRHCEKREKGEEGSEGEDDVDDSAYVAVFFQAPLIQLINRVII